MKRRAALLVALLVVIAPAAGAPQSSKVARLGILLYSSPRTDPNVATFLEQMRELGHVEGRNLAIDYRYAEGRPERLPALAVELVRLKPDVIYALGGDVVLPVVQATRTIPVVAVTSNDPVRVGLAASLARPGGNVTGTTFILEELAGRRLALLKEIVPEAARVGVLWNPDHADPEFRELERGAQTLGVRVVSLEVRRGEELETAFAAATAARIEALVIVSSRLVNLHRQRIEDFAARSRLPLVADWGAWAESGALFQYGPNPVEMIRRSAYSVDRILRGARPGDLPFERPTRFHLIVNGRVARGLGIALPPSLLLRADRVIE